MAKLHKGDRVRWNTSQGETDGEIVAVREQDFQLHEQKYRASRDEPMYIVESEGSGKRAAHRADALKRISS